MKYEVKTKTGSTYILDNITMTWDRVVAGKGSNQVRTAGGPLLEWPIITVGEGIEMYGPPLTEGADVRCIYTSDVQSWKELECLIPTKPIVPVPPAS